MLDACSLRKDVAERSTAKALLEHEFMQFEIDNTAVVEWLKATQTESQDPVEPSGKES